jgi:hypothetical protein
MPTSCRRLEVRAVRSEGEDRTVDDDAGGQRRCVSAGLRNRDRSVLREGASSNHDLRVAGTCDGSAGRADHSRRNPLGTASGASAAASCEQDRYEQQAGKAPGSEHRDSPRRWNLRRLQQDSRIAGAKAANLLVGLEWPEEH